MLLLYFYINNNIIIIIRLILSNNGLEILLYYIYTASKDTIIISQKIFSLLNSSVSRIIITGAWIHGTYEEYTRSEEQMREEQSTEPYVRYDSLLSLGIVVAASG